MGLIAATSNEFQQRNLKNRITARVVFLGMIFVTFLILSNLTAFKIAEFHLSRFAFIDRWFGNVDINFPAALIFFPLTYFFDDALTEVYGFAVSRLIIWSGLFCNSIFTLGALLTVHLHSSSFWHDQSQFALVLDAAPRIFVASLIGYFCGEFLNSMVISKIKIITKGRWLWLRVVSSTGLGVLIDSTLFCAIAFFGKIPNNIIINMIIVQFVFKISYEIIALPFTYWLVGYLKRKDQIDFYDIKTSYNPFSLSLDQKA